MPPLEANAADVEVVATFSVIADSVVPISTWFVTLLNWGLIHRGAGSRFTPRVAGTVMVEMHGLQISELVEIGEEEVPTF
jgi:hypothetical protein